MAEDQEGTIFDYGRLEEVVDSMAEQALEAEDEEVSEEKREVVTEVIYNQWRRRGKEIEQEIINEIEEDVTDAAGVSVSLNEISPDAQEKDQNKENEEEIEEETITESSEANDKIEEAENGIEEEEAVDEIEEVEDDLVEEEIVDEELVEMSDTIHVEDSYGVETLHMGDYQVKIDGRTEGPHKELLYVAEQEGLIQDHGLSDQDVNTARQSLRDNGNFTTDYGDLEEELPENAKEKIKEKLKDYGYLGNEESAETSEDQETQTVEDEGGQELVYTLDDGTLEMFDEDEEYILPVDDAPVMEALGALTGILSQDRIRHKDEDTGSEHINEEHYRAIAELQDAGVVEGSEAQGFNVTIDLPNGLDEEIQEYVAAKNILESEDVYQAQVTRVGPNGDAFISYEEGHAKITDPSEYLEPGYEIHVRESGKVDGQQRATIVEG